MPLNKASLLPHSPLLIPEIGRANHALLNKTSVAYQQVAAEMKEAGIETVVIISPHGLSQENNFTLNVAPEMRLNFKDFGFIQRKNFLLGDSLLADQIKKHLGEIGAETKLKLVSEADLDYGSAIPAYLLKGLLSDFRLIVLAPAENLNLQEHFLFGKQLQEIFQAQEKPIAVIASGDLSHRLKRKSPGGYSPKGAKFDNKIIEYLSEPKDAAENIFKLDAKLIKEAGECALKPIVILLGLISKLPTDPKILAYQTDFGIGYLSLDYKL